MINFNFISYGMTAMTGQSAFTLPDSQPEFDAYRNDQSWTRTIFLLICWTFANLILFTLLTLLSAEAQALLKFCILIQIMLTTLILKRPVALFIERFFLCIPSFGSLSLIIDAFIGILTDFIIVLGVCLMSFVLLLFPTNVLDDWDEFPWTFFGSYSVFLLSIFKAMRFLCRLLVNIALYQYDTVKMHSRIRELLAHATTVAVLVRFTRPVLQKNPSELREWRRTIYDWGLARLESTCRRRFEHAVDELMMIDGVSLAKRCWSAFKDSQRQCPGATWTDFADSILVNGADGCPDTPLVSSNIENEEQLARILCEIQDNAKNLKIEIAEQNRLFSQLEKFFSVACVLLMVFVVLPWMGFRPNAYLLPLGVSITPTVMAMTVIFGQSISSMISSIIFTFYIHPFDVNDEVRIEKAFFRIKQIGLISVMMENSAGLRVYYPSAVLSQMGIVNVSRGSYQVQTISIKIPSTAEIDHHQLGTEIVDQINKANAGKSVGEFMHSIDTDDKIFLLITIKYNGKAETASKNNAMKVVVSVTQELPISSISNTLKPIQL